MKTYLVAIPTIDGGYFISSCVQPIVMQEVGSGFDTEKAIVDIANENAEQLAAYPPVTEDEAIAFAEELYYEDDLDEVDTAREYCVYSVEYEYENCNVEEL